MGSQILTVPPLLRRGLLCVLKLFLRYSNSILIAAAVFLAKKSNKIDNVILKSFPNDQLNERTPEPLTLPSKK